MVGLKAAAVWIVILIGAVLNGALRESVLRPAVGGQTALPLSGVLLCVWILLVAVVLARWIGIRGAGPALGVGLLWLCLTLGFEFGFGRLVEQRSWEALLEAYTFRGGNIWPVVLVVTFFAPLAAARLRG